MPVGLHNCCAHERAVEPPEAGFALPSAIIILFVITMLTAAAISIATQTSTSTTRDGNSKAALEAAEAGLQVARYRINMLKPTETQCINESAVVTATVEEVESKCKAASVSLGNGASFQYWTTLPLKAGEKCVGAAVAGTTSRCITATGTVNGIAQRAQTRVGATSGGALFPLNGVFGDKRVLVENHGHLKAAGGTNGKFEIKNEGSAETVYLGEGEGKKAEVVGGPYTKKVEESKPYVLAEVPIGESATSNSNASITAGYEASSRKLNIVSKTITLSEGTYNFCNFIVENEATIKISGKVKIFIDSEARAGSGCKTSNGGKSEFIVRNHAKIENPAKLASALQIFIYDGSGGKVEIENEAAFYGTIYAPHSRVNLGNHVKYVGAVAAYEAELENEAEFLTDASVSEVTSSETGHYLRGAWGQCTPTGTPKEGC
jgi:Tfp pilus assembly protein PilX